MPLFKVQKPFISYRVYISIDANDKETATQFNLEWDKEYNCWYLDGHKYKESQISKDQSLKRSMQPFKVYGRHQYFL